MTNQQSNKVKKITEEEACKLVCDARISGIRWDVLQWSVILDLDVPVSEGEGAQLKRVWVVFSGLSTLSAMFDNARLPTGVFAKSEMWVEDSCKDKRLRKASFRIVYADDSHSVAGGRQTHEVSIVSKEIFGVSSIETCSSADNYRGLTWEQRNCLASDHELREALNGANTKSRDR